MFFRPIGGGIIEANLYTLAVPIVLTVCSSALLGAASLKLSHAVNWSMPAALVLPPYWGRHH